MPNATLTTAPDPDLRLRQWLEQDGPWFGSPPRVEFLPSGQVKLLYSGRTVDLPLKFAEWQDEGGELFYDPQTAQGWVQEEAYPKWWRAKLDVIRRRAAQGTPYFVELLPSGLVRLVSSGKTVPIAEYYKFEAEDSADLGLAVAELEAAVARQGMRVARANPLDDACPALLCPARPAAPGHGEGRAAAPLGITVEGLVMALAYVGFPFAGVTEQLWRPAPSGVFRGWFDAEAWAPGFEPFRGNDRYDSLPATDEARRDIAVYIRKFLEAAAPGSPGGSLCQHLLTLPDAPWRRHIAPANVYLSHTHALPVEHLVRTMLRAPQMPGWFQVGWPTGPVYYWVDYACDQHTDFDPLARRSVIQGIGRTVLEVDDESDVQHYGADVKYFADLACVFDVVATVEGMPLESYPEVLCARGASLGAAVFSPLHILVSKRDWAVQYSYKKIFGRQPRHAERASGRTPQETEAIHAYFLQYKRADHGKGEKDGVGFAAVNAAFEEWTGRIMSKMYNE